MFKAYPLWLRQAQYWREKPRFLKHVESSPTWTMMAVEEGTFNFQIDGVLGKATSGDIVLCPPTIDFHRKALTPLSFFYIKFFFQRPESLEEKRFIDLVRNEYKFKFTTPEQDRLYNNYRHMLSYFMLQDVYSERWITHYVNDIWMLFYVEIESLARYGDVANNPVMHDAKNWIDRNAFNNIQMKDVASLFDMDASHFTRRFQKAFGISPSRYLFSIRMEMAKSLLVQSDHTIDHIARQCGYDNGYYFSRIFTKYMKMNPSKFRKIYTMQSQ